MHTDLFKDITTAFSYKSDKDLKCSYFIFKIINNNFLNKLSIALTPTLVRYHFPLIKSILRATIFKQFMGGEKLKNTPEVIHKLAKYNIDTILDYASEGKNTEEEFEKATEIFLKSLDFAKNKKNVPFVSVKLTALGSTEFFTEFNTKLTLENILSSTFDSENINSDLQKNYTRIEARIQKIIEKAKEHNKSVLFDAEESWIQKSIDFFVHKFIRKYNKKSPLVYNTIQLYRSDKIAEIEKYCAQSQKENFILALKLVRGAYMEKEAEYAKMHNTLSPIHSSKEGVDRDYDKAVSLCLNANVHTIVATHNEQSIRKALTLLNTHPMKADTYFSQLYGMGDYLSFNLSKIGYKVCKYVPFGSIREAIPYLIRRAQENSSFQGQSAQEFAFITEEMKRRNLLL